MHVTLGIKVIGHEKGEEPAAADTGDPKKRERKKQSIRGEEKENRKKANNVNRINTSQFTKKATFTSHGARRGHVSPHGGLQARQRLELEQERDRLRFDNNILRSTLRSSPTAPSPLDAQLP